MKTIAMALPIFFLLVTTLMLVFPIYADTPAEKFLKKPDAWFQSVDGQRSLANILSWQTEHGDWPKNIDTTSRPWSGSGNKQAGTFDNGATSGELRILARAFRITGDKKYAQAFLHGFDHILKAQYANGGWPQFYPLSQGYHRHVTFNDGTMIRLMEFAARHES